MDTDSGNIKRELEEIVARLLPGIVAEQLAALELPGYKAGSTTDSGSPGAAIELPAHSPGWAREAADALTAFSRQLDWLEFDAQSPDVTSDMRHYYGTAVEARDHAARLLAGAGRRNKSKEVYAAIGRGREALIRLGALRDGRPVPLELLTPEELSGAPHPPLTAYTGDRFRWSGKDSAEFLLDRPAPYQPVPYRVVSYGGGVYVTLMQRTEQRVAQHDKSWVYEKTIQGIAGPAITHVAIQRTSAKKWVFELLDPDRLSPLQDRMRGIGSATFRHEAGAVQAIAQCEQPTIIRFYAECDCLSFCRKPTHLEPSTIKWFDGVTRDEITLPRERGMIEIDTAGRWTIDVTPRQSGA